MRLVLASRGPNWGWEQSPTSGRRLQDQRACGMKDGGIHRKPPLLWRVLERSDHVPACPGQSGFLPAAGIITSSVPFLSKGVQAWMLHCMSPDGGTYLSIMNWRIPSLKPQITEFFLASFKSHCRFPSSTEPSHVQGDLGSGPRAV